LGFGSNNVFLVGYSFRLIPVKGIFVFNGVKELIYFVRVDLMLGLFN